MAGDRLAEPQVRRPVCHQSRWARLQRGWREDRQRGGSWHAAPLSGAATCCVRCAPRSTSDGALTPLTRKVGHARPTAAVTSEWPKSRPGTRGTWLSLSLILVRSHRPERLIVAGCIVPIVQRRIAIDHGPHEHRMGCAAHLVLDREQRLAAVEIDDVAEPVLVLIVLARDQIARQQLAIG